MSVLRERGSGVRLGLTTCAIFFGSGAVLLHPICSTQSDENTAMTWLASPPTMRTCPLALAAGRSPPRHRHHFTVRSILINRNSRTVSWCCFQWPSARAGHSLQHTPRLSGPWWVDPRGTLDPNCGAEISCNPRGGDDGTSSVSASFHNPFRRQHPCALPCSPVVSFRIRRLNVCQSHVRFGS